MHDIFFILAVSFNLHIRFGKEEWSLEKHSVPVKCLGEIQLRFCVHE
jgi:hypothetical protein